jgi:hypothetical protein
MACFSPGRYPSPTGHSLIKGINRLFLTWEVSVSHKALANGLLDTVPVLAPIRRASKRPPFTCRSEVDELIGCLEVLIGNPAQARLM